MYKERCWANAAKIDRFVFDTVIEKGDEAFVTCRGWLKNGETMRNTEFFRFVDGKIKEVDVFFGRPHVAAV